LCIESASGPQLPAAEREAAVGRVLAGGYLFPAPKATVLALMRPPGGEDTDAIARIVARTFLQD
jgi:hypothetical protein